MSGIQQLSQLSRVKPGSGRRGIYDIYIIIIYLQNPDTYNRCSAKNKVKASKDINTIILESADSIVESVDSIRGNEQGARFEFP